MSAAFPPHYAVSEALVAVAGSVGVYRVAPASRLGALGLAPFALAGLVGAVRIAAGLTGPITDVHRFLARPGALFGLACLVAALAAGRRWAPSGFGFAALIAALLVVARLATDPLRAAHPALAWHLFHVAAAAWLVLAARLLARA